MSMDEVRSVLPAARGRFLAAFGALPEITSDAEEWFEESGPTHYDGHLPDLERGSPSSARPAEERGEIPGAGEGRP
jgi:hypothetical protein